MNEPEWILSDIPLPSVAENMTAVNMSQFWRISSLFANAVHNYTQNQKFTMGSASLKWYKIWLPEFAIKKQLPVIDIDIYQSHYYPWMNGQETRDNPDLGTVKWSPLEQRFSDLELDKNKQMFIGEFGNMETGPTMDGILKMGYSGALPWSFQSTDDIKINWKQYYEWYLAHRDIITKKTIKI